MEAAIKKLTAINKWKLIGKTGTEVRKILFRLTDSGARSWSAMPERVQLSELIC